MRPIKFNAFIPDLKITILDVAIYPDGMIGFSSDAFESALPEKYKLEDDSVYHVDFTNGNDIYEHVMSILPGEEWIWLDSGQYELMQYTGLKDKNGVEIYEGDILSEKWKCEVFVNTEGAFMVKFGLRPDLNKPISLLKYLSQRKKDGSYEEDCVVIGNIHD